MNNEKRRVHVENASKPHFLLSRINVFTFFKISNLLFISGAHYTSSLVSLYKKLGSVANLGWYRQGGEKMVFHLIAMELHGRMQLIEQFSSDK